METKGSAARVRMGRHSAAAETAPYSLGRSWLGVGGLPLLRRVCRTDGGMMCLDIVGGAQRPAIGCGAHRHSRQAAGENASMRSVSRRGANAEPRPPVSFLQ